VVLKNLIFGYNVLMIDNNHWSLKVLKYGLLFLLISMPFYAFISVFVASVIGHYTIVRLYKEFILLFLMIVAIYLVIIDRKLRQVFFSNNIVRLIIIFAFIVIISGLVAKYFNLVSTKSLEFGLIVDLRFFLVFTISFLVGLKIKLSDNQLIKSILWPASLVIVFAILEFFFLPRNFLSHFGYGPKTIEPFQTINNNSHFVRVLSFLRGSNELGAYLIIPITLLAVLFYQSKHKILIVLFIILAIIALIASFSRSAWLGALLSLALIFYFRLPTKRLKKFVSVFVLFLIIIFIGSLFVFKNNTTYQNIIYHYSNHSSSPISSDYAHFKALKNGFNSLLHDPLGSGTGTAGPASIYNLKPPRISENFYLQIGLEQGLLGLLVFLLIIVLILRELWLSRDFNNLVLFLLSSTLGICLVNLFLPEFADDTMSYVLWIMLGWVIGNKYLLI